LSNLKFDFEVKDTIAVLKVLKRTTSINSKIHYSIKN